MENVVNTDAFLYLEVFDGPSSKEAIMNANTLKIFAASLAFVALPVFADDAHHPESGAALQASPAKVAKKKTSEPKASVAASRNNKALEQMRKTKDLMTKIQQTSDPSERRKLMDEHMQAMHDNMRMMREMGGGMRGGMMMGMGGGKAMQADQGSMGCPMMGNQGMMEMRMDMMQSMMEQMMLRDQVQASTPPN